MKLKLALALTAFLPLAAIAHEGHGSSNAHSLMHYLSEPLHLLPIAIVAVAGWYIWRRRKTS